ncbi:211_t:CDS:2 [Racocetra fulgida]|uniref:211_t:CDS:1 n=1 Tax=Racocetra fulgida TaxID=60492 RepID=A0A9N8W2Z6_9GLOM|nr:211_t:CDS:2 [Racocetra fulgida]
MEIIKDELYVYARDINYTGTNLMTKMQLPGSSNSESLTSSKLTYSKLLAAHHNITEKGFEASNLTNLINTSTSNVGPSKYIEIKKVNELAKDLLGIDDLELANITYVRNRMPVNQNMSEDHYKDLDRSDKEKNPNELATEDNENEKDDNFKFAKRVRGHGRGSKNRGHSTCKVRKTCNTKLEHMS